MMTRKHYIALAKDLRDAMDSYPDVTGENKASRAAKSVARAAVQDVALRMAETMAADNPHFDRVVFLHAAGVAPFAFGMDARPSSRNTV